MQHLPPQMHPSRSNMPPYPGGFFNSYPQPPSQENMDSNESNYQDQSYSEQYQGEASESSGKEYEEDTGEFGGLVSYFSSQREDNLDS